MYKCEQNSTLSNRSLTVLRSEFSLFTCTIKECDQHSCVIGETFQSWTAAAELGFFGGLNTAARDVNYIQRSSSGTIRTSRFGSIWQTFKFLSSSVQRYNNLENQMKGFHFFALTLLPCETTVFT